MQAEIMATTAGMSREEWRELRRRGIGGSDAAAIMGVNPWMSPLAVYMDKLGIAPEKDESEAMRQGTDLEDYVARRFMEATGKTVHRVNRILQHKDFPFMLGNIDRRIVGENAGLECKTTSVYNRTEFDQGDVPATYYWQCQHYMAVTGCERWYLAVLVLNSAFHPFCVDRNEDHIRQLIERENDFWHYNVLSKSPPLPCGSEQDCDLISFAHPTQTSDDLIALPTLDDDAALIKILERDKRALETRIDEAKQRIKVAIGDATGAVSAGWQATWKAQDRRTIDADRLRSELPDIAAQYTKTTSSRVLRLKEAKAS